MFRGTTPEFRIKIKDVVLSDYTAITITIEQDDVDIVKRTEDLTITEDMIIVRLTQEDTLSLDAGYCEIQMRGLTASGIAIATYLKKIKVEDILGDGEIYD